MKYAVHIVCIREKKHVNYERFSLESIKEIGGLEEFGTVGRAILNIGWGCVVVIHLKIG
jgi:hypothetical protein